MKVKDIKEALENCSDELEIDMHIVSHQHLYSEMNDELGRVDINQRVPLNSVTIKNADGYGYVVLSNLRD